MPLLLVAAVLASTVLASSLDRSMLMAVLHRGNPGFKRCYEEALKRDSPQLGGKARLTFTISARGTVDEVSVEFPQPAPEFTQCLRGVAMHLRFPEGPAAYTVVWPILFQGS